MQIIVPWVAVGGSTWGLSMKKESPSINISMNMYLSQDMHVCVYVCMYVCIYVYIKHIMYIYIYTCIIYVYIYLPISIYLYLYLYLHLYFFTHGAFCTYNHCMYSLIHTYIPVIHLNRTPTPRVFCGEPEPGTPRADSAMRKKPDETRGHMETMSSPARDSVVFLSTVINVR